MLRDFPIEFAEIKERMERLGVSGNDLCWHVDSISTATLSHWLRGNYTYTKRNIYNDIKAIQKHLSDCEILQSRSAGPLDWTQREKIKAQIEKLNAEQDPGAATPEDFSILSDVILGTPGQQIAERLQIPLEALTERISEANKRFDFTLNQLRGWNQQSAHLREIQRAEHDKAMGR